MEPHFSIERVLGLKWRLKVDILVVGIDTFLFRTGA